MTTGKTYHQYIHPGRPRPQGAFEVHGLGDDFLTDQPFLKAIAQDFVDFVGTDVMVIHNAAFDMKFLNAELGWLGRPALPLSQSLDTLAMARKRFPGSPASLDALGRGVHIATSSRTLPGAWHDREVLATV